jgi:facilitated trehalose transporter
MLTALSSAGLSFGVLIQYTMGAFLHWKMLSAFSCLVPVAAFIGMLSLPETPNYLVSHQKPEKASKSLAKLRGSSYNLQKEIDTLQNFANKTNAKKFVQEFSSSLIFSYFHFFFSLKIDYRNLSAKETFQALLEPACLKPFAILVIYFMMYQFSGVNTITFYAVQIFQESGTSMDKNTATIVLGGLRFVFTIIACILLRRSGRRPLSFVSGIGCCISMFILAGYMFYKDQSVAQGVQPLYTWIPVLAIFTFIITCTLGFLVCCITCKH